MKITKIFFFGNGNCAAFDKDGEQVTAEQGSAFLDALQDKLNRGVINENTQVDMNGWEGSTVAEYIKSNRLQIPPKSQKA